jgi:hypothetical protein
MAKKTKNAAMIPNPALQPLSVLVGEWETVGTHRLIPNTLLHGHTSFSWIEGGAFLLTHSEIEEKVGIPNGIAIFGSDDKTATLFMLYFDERAVARKFDVTMQGNTLHYWRNVPGFSQRFTGTLADDQQTIIGVSELSEDDATWQRDLELTYTRVSERSSKASAPRK